MGKLEYKKYDDDVNLHQYWKVIMKRKWLLLTVFFGVIIVTSFVNLTYPKIYRVNLIYKMATPEFVDLLEKFNVNEPKNLRNIFPNTFQSVDEIHACRYIDEFHPSIDSASTRVKIDLDIIDTSQIPTIISELKTCIDNFPVYRNSIDQMNTLREVELEDIKKEITSTEEIVNKNDLQIQTKNYLVSLKSRKLFLEQSLKDNSTTELTYQYLYSNPIKPQMARNISLMGIIGFLSALFLIFIGRLAEKFKTPPQL